MVVTKIIGGLGNQMFQFAAGECLARRWGTSHKLDISAFTGYRLHNGFELFEVFNLPVEIASPEETAKFKKSDLRPWSKFLKKLSFAPNDEYYLEKSFAFNTIPPNRSASIYLDGYWQSEKYFGDDEAHIRKLFQFAKPLTQGSEGFLEKMKRGQSVSLHVRRGDYVSNKQTSAFHGVVGLDYYKSAISIIENKVDRPHFFVFSDDIEWCKKELAFGTHPVDYVDGNTGTSSWEDLALMSKCRHNIIANSSFSWWGAWLNNHSDKVVIAPKPWFFTTTLDTKDILPKNWLENNSSFLHLS